MMTRGHRQEALCRAYVQAVTSLAGVGISVPTPDYGVDLSLRHIEQRGQRFLDSGVQLDLQLRSTTRANLTDTHVGYDLDVQTYEFLREPSQVRCLLVVLVLPGDETLWLSQSPEEMVLRHCAYWYSLRGTGPTTATSSIRISVPRPQIFSVPALQAMMHRLSQGEEP